MRAGSVKLNLERKLVAHCVAAALLLTTSVGVAAPPDFSGVWERYPPLHDPAATPEGIFAEGAPLPGGEPKLREPYAKQYQEIEKRRAAAEENGQPLADASVRCLPSGMPMMMTAILPLEILQTRAELVILAEELAEIRRIDINGKLPPLDETAPSYHGYSVARWEGATLVIRTQGVREQVQFMDIPHSKALRITERLRLIAPDMLEDRISLDDPDILAQPYQFTFKYKRNSTYKIAEYVCDNNHYDVNGSGDVHFSPDPGH
jgi:hypothetical protein